MVWTCAVGDCPRRQTHQKKLVDRTFHRFPRDVKLRKEWIQWVKVSRGCGDKAQWKPLKFSGVCGDHFLPSDFVDGVGKLKRLKNGVVPSQLQFISNQTKKKTNQISSRGKSAVRFQCTDSASCRRLQSKRGSKTTTTSESPNNLLETTTSSVSPNNLSKTNTSSVSPKNLSKATTSSESSCKLSSTATSNESSHEVSENTTSTSIEASNTAPKTITLNESSRIVAMIHTPWKPLWNKVSLLSTPTTELPSKRIPVKTAPLREVSVPSPNKPLAPPPPASKKPVLNTTPFKKSWKWTTVGLISSSCGESTSDKMMSQRSDTSSKAVNTTDASNEPPTKKATVTTEPFLEERSKDYSYSWPGIEKVLEKANQDLAEANSKLDDKRRELKLLRKKIVLRDSKLSSFVEELKSQQVLTQQQIDFLNSLLLKNIGKCSEEENDDIYRGALSG